jgi:hypothetical protein
VTLRVIGAGFGRTGTQSLQAALEALGFAPCYPKGSPGVWQFKDRECRCRAVKTGSNSL